MDQFRFENDRITASILPLVDFLYTGFMNLFFIGR